MTPVRPSILKPALPRQPWPVNRVPSAMGSLLGMTSLPPGGPCTGSTPPFPVPIRWVSVTRKEGPSGPSAVADAEEVTHAGTVRESTRDDTRGLGQPPGDL